MKLFQHFDFFDRGVLLTVKSLNLFFEKWNSYCYDIVTRL
jgi:hypothetical protein